MTGLTVHINVGNEEMKGKTEYWRLTELDFIPVEEIDIQPDIKITILLM